MGAHVDSGDLNAGMTTMSCFREGDYDGAYLVFPRYGITIDAPDNSVIIADSNQVHGVTQIEGKDKRFTCVHTVTIDLQQRVLLVNQNVR